jgi:hypothetical protein
MTQFDSLRDTIANRNVAETEVSPSNFIFAAKDIVCYRRVPPADRNEI